MGCRLHVAKCHKVQYANIEAFNYKCEEFHHLLGALCVEYTGESWDNDFEAYKSDWENAIASLKNFDNLEQCKKDYIKECLESLNCSLDQAIELFQKCLDASDPDNDYMFFSFF